MACSAKQFGGVSSPGRPAALVLNCLDRDKHALPAIYDWHSDYQDTASQLLAKAERIARATKEVVRVKADS